jgi:hypothetical protein
MGFMTNKVIIKMNYGERNEKKMRKINNAKKSYLSALTRTISKPSWTKLR